MNRKRNKTSKSIQFAAGSLMVVLGIALILAWWPDVAVLFKGAARTVIALAGMILLYMAGSE